MKRWFTGLVAIAVLTAIAFTVRTIRKAHRDKARVAADEYALVAYSQAFKPGISRKKVEDSLRKRGTRFSERCCIASHSAFSILVKVGEEDAPWFCNAWPDYVVFEFAATQPAPLPLRPLDSDLLKSVHLTSNGEGCL